jgi:hypothetical protein
MPVKMDKRISDAIDNTWQTCADDFENNIGRAAVRCEILELLLDYIPHYTDEETAKIWKGMPVKDKFLAVQHFFGWDSYFIKRCNRCNSEPDCPYLEV